VAHVVDRRHPRLPVDHYSREESMLGEIIAVAKSTFICCLSAAGRLLKKLLRPAPATVVAGVVQDAVRSKCELVAENAMLRQQLIVVRRAVKRPSLRNGDRLFMVLLARLNRAWRGALHLIQPDTLLRWHRDLFKLVWRRKSRTSRREPRVPQETIDLIKKIAGENTWGAERIRGELLKLGIKVSKRTVQRHMRGVREPKKPPQDWNTFLSNHAKDVWACDFVQVFDVFFRPIFAFFIIEHESRRVIHFNVTRSPNDAWVAQALREATAYCQGPRFLIRDNDDKFGAKFDAVAKACETKVIRTAVKAPLMNSICERFLGSVRRECLDHILILGEGHLRRVLAEYAGYFVESRPHQGLGQRTPAQVTKGELLSNVILGAPADVESIPVLGGLHHEYRRAA
jgi:transposase InsO family protein